MVVDQLPRLGKRELICLLLFTCNYVVFVWRGFFFLWVLGMGYVILLCHSLSLPYNYFTKKGMVATMLILCFGLDFKSHRCAGGTVLLHHGGVLTNKGSPPPLVCII